MSEPVVSPDEELAAAWREWFGYGETPAGRSMAHSTLAAFRRHLDEHGFAIVRRLKMPAVIE